MRRTTLLCAGVLAVGLAFLPARAGTLDQLDKELTALAARATKSVVTVTGELKIAIPPGPVPGWPATDVTARRLTSSGVVYDEKGHIVTVASAVGPGRKLTVTLSDGRQVPAKLVGRDLASNLAVLKVEAEGLTPAVWGSSADVRPGAVVMAVGSSFGMGPNVTLGMVSAVGRSVAGHADLIQITAPINPGDSGGMLVNARGELIGIVTATFGRAPSSDWLRRFMKDFPEKLRNWKPGVPDLSDPGAIDPGGSLEKWRQEFEKRIEELEQRLHTPGADTKEKARGDAPAWVQVYTAAGPGRAVGRAVLADAVDARNVLPRLHLGSQGMNYALPADSVKPVVEQLIKHGKVARGWLGVLIEERADDLPGLVVADVVAGSPAAKAGIARGDRILTIDAVKVDSFAALARTVARRPPGATLKVVLKRGDKDMTVTPLLTEKPEDADVEPPDDVEAAPVPPPVPPRDRDGRM